MTATQTLKIVEILSRHFKDEHDAKEVVTELESIIENKFTDTKSGLATKTDIANLRTELKTDMANLKVDIIKWSIGFGLTQTATILGFLYFWLTKH